MKQRLMTLAGLMVLTMGYPAAMMAQNDGMGLTERYNADFRGYTTTPWGPGEGTHELRLAGALDIVSGNDYDVRDLSAQVTYNWFWMDRVSLGGSVLTKMSTVDYLWGEETISRLFFLGRGDYYFRDFADRLVPYLGGHIGFVSWKFVDESGTAMAYGGQGGVLYMLTEKSAVNCELLVSQYNEERSFGEDETTMVLSLLFGFSHYF